MKTTKIVGTSCLFAVLLCFGLGSAQAQPITNNGNGGALTAAGSWIGGVAPINVNNAVWDVNTTASYPSSVTLGAAANWKGIQILNPAVPIDISDTYTLTLGANGIDMTLATEGLTLAVPVVLGASQSWIVTTGQTLTAGGAVSGSGVLTLGNGNTNNVGSIVLSVGNTYTGGTTINSGIVYLNTITAFGTGTVTLNGGVLECANAVHSGIMVNAFAVAGTPIIDMDNLGVSFVFDGAWSGTGTILVTNDTASGSTLTFGGASGGNMASFTGSIIVADNFTTPTASAGTLRFNNGGSQVNSGNALMSVNLGGTLPGSPGSSCVFVNRDAGTTSFGALTGGSGTSLQGQTSGNGTLIWSIGGLNTSTTFAGGIANHPGSTTAISALTKVGTGTFTLTSLTNTYTGATTVSAGTLQIGDGGADGSIGTGAITIGSSGTLAFDSTSSFTLANNISGGGALVITGGANMTYTGVDSASGALDINNGYFTISGSGAVASPVYIAAGSTFDVSAVTFSLNQALSGSGTVVSGTAPFTAAAGSISPGAGGALTFSNGLTENGNVINNLVLSTTSAPAPINVVGNLTLGGVNTINLTHLGGGTIANGTYPLIAYTTLAGGGIGNFNVNVQNATGTLIYTDPGIAVVISPPVRGPLNLTWIGGGANDWDTTSYNWTNGGTDYMFQTGDSVLFNDVGVPNTNVNLLAAMSPAAVVVNSTHQYTFTNAGNISGSTTSLTKTNSGTLTVLTTNTYAGQTIVGQGVLEVMDVALSGVASGIGEANSDPSNLVFFGSTFQYSGPTSLTDHGMTLDSTGVTIDVTNASTDLTLTGLLTGPGALTQIGPGTLTLGDANTYAGGTVLSNGVLALGSDNANNNGAGGSGVGATNNPVTFYGGTLQLYGYGLSDTPNYNTFYNPLVVPAGQTGTLLLFPRGPVNTGASSGLNCSLSGGGTLNLVVNYVRDALSGNWSAFTGLINVTNRNASGDEFRINNNFGYANATLSLNGTFTMDYALASNATIEIGALGGSNTVTIGPGNTSMGGPTWSVGWNNATATFAGTIEDDSTGGTFSTSITKVGTGTWYLAGQNTFTGSTTISNGVLALTNVGNGDGSIGSSTNIFINAGAFLDASGTSSFTMPLSSGQVLSGNGTITGILDTTGGGTVSPGGGTGGGIGILTVTNDINLGGTAWMKINRTNSPRSDLLVSSHSYINYGGTLRVVNTGPALVPGDTFTLFSGSAYNNSFNNLVFPNYTTWDTSKLATNGSVKYVGPGNPPSFSTVDFSQLAGGTITFNATNGAANGVVIILSSTNLALPASSWTPVVTNNFDGNGNLTGLAVTVDPTQPQEFYTLEAY